MQAHHASIRRARRQRSYALTGFIVTWDVDSSDTAQCYRVRRFIFGRSVTSAGKTYRYPGFVEREGVRYPGQSVLFVTRTRLEELRSFLHKEAVDHVVVEASIGGLVPC